MKIYFKKAKFYTVSVNEDGSLFITEDGTTSISHAGAFIVDMGGVDVLRERMKQSGDISYEECLELRKQAAKDVENRKIEKAEQRRQERERQYKTLVSKGAVSPTAENLRIIMSYLNEKNWGSWNLPSLTVGYTAMQYDCDGRVATAFVFDKPVDIDGLSTKRVCYGAPRGHLTKYTRI